MKIRTRKKRLLHTVSSNRLRILERFSAGKITRYEAVRRLNLKYYSQLLDKLGAAKLPLFALPIRITNEMVAEVLQLVRNAER
jgi:hypothetical protein